MAVHCGHTHQVCGAEAVLPARNSQAGDGTRVLLQDVFTDEASHTIRY